MNDISARIKKLVDDYADGNNSKFAQIVGTSEVNVRNYINGTQPKYEFLNKVANKFKIDCEWLLLGDLRKNAVEEPSIEYKTLSEFKIDILHQRIEDLQNRLKDKEEIIDLLKLQMGLSKQTG